MIEVARRYMVYEVAPALVFITVFFAIATLAGTFVAMVWGVFVSILAYIGREEFYEVPWWERVFWLAGIAMIAGVAGAVFAGWPPAPQGVIVG